MLKISPETPGRGEELHLDAARQGLAPTVGSQGKPIPVIRSPVRCNVYSCLVRTFL